MDPKTKELIELHDRAKISLMKSNTEKLNEQNQRTSNILHRCPDYDEDCMDMTMEHAHWCFMGCHNHPCAPDHEMGIARGHCPIIHPEN